MQSTLKFFILFVGMLALSKNQVCQPSQKLTPLGCRTAAAA